MPIGTRPRTRTPSVPTVDLPPPFRLVRLREVGDAFAHARGIASAQGAGTVVHVGRFDMAEFAVVLEPEEPLKGARRAFYVGAAALLDALCAHAPPEKPISVEWPGAIYVDGGLVGGARLAWPDDSDENEPPPWLVFGAMIRIAGLGEREPGRPALGTALEEEGFENLGPVPLLESFTRYLMAAVDAWQTGEFAQPLKRYLERLKVDKGALCQIDDNGDLLLRRAGLSGEERRSLVEALAVSAWLDPATGAPRT